MAATKGPTLWPVLLVASISGAVVAAVAIYASYSHMHDLVLLTGEDEALARFVPASIDALVIFAAAVAWAQRRAGEKVHPMAPAAGWLAGVVSLSANVVSKWPAVATSPLARVLVAAWPAVAVIVMGHLGVQLIGLVLRERRATPTRPPAAAAAGRSGTSGGGRARGAVRRNSGQPASVPAAVPAGPAARSGQSSVQRSGQSSVQGSVQRAAGPVSPAGRTEDSPRDSLTGAQDSARDNGEDSARDKQPVQATRTKRPPKLTVDELVTIARDIPDLSRTTLQDAVRSIPERNGVGANNNDVAEAVKRVLAEREAAQAAAGTNGSGQP